MLSFFFSCQLKKTFKHRFKEYFKLSTDHATRENPSNFHQIWREMKNRTVSAPLKILNMSQIRLCVVIAISEIDDTNLICITSMIYDISGYLSVTSSLCVKAAQASRRLCGGVVGLQGNYSN